MVSYNTVSLLHGHTMPGLPKLKKTKEKPRIVLDVTVSAAKTAFVKEILKPHLI